MFSHIKCIFWNQTVFSEQPNILCQYYPYIENKIRYLFEMFINLYGFAMVNEMSQSSIINILYSITSVNKREFYRKLTMKTNKTSFIYE